MNIHCIHLRSNPFELREKRSYAQISQLPNYGIQYTEIINPPWTGEVPEPRYAEDRPFHLTKAHYGCWKAHRDAIVKHLADCDALLICECDCIPTGTLDEFVGRVNRAATACEDYKLDAFTLGYKHGAKILERPSSDVILISQWIGTHCYIAPRKSHTLFFDMFEKPWDAYDYCTTVYLFDHQHCRIGTFSDKPIAVQADGKSIVSGVVYSTESHYRYARHDR